MHTKPPGNQKKLRSIPYMELAAFCSSGSREDTTGFLPYLGMAASWSQDNEASEYDQEIQLSVAPDQPTTS